MKFWVGLGLVIGWLPQQSYSQDLNPVNPLLDLPECASSVEVAQAPSSEEAPSDSPAEEPKGAKQKKDPEYSRKLIEKKMKEAPTAPPSLPKRKEIQMLGCDRSFTYLGKTYPLDSYHAQDGEHLRPIIRNETQAVAELNSYQSNRRKIRLAAYAGTLGMLTIIASGIVANQYADSSSAKKTVRYVGLMSGVAIGAGTMLYTFGILRTNESHLGEAVRLHNANRPNQAIQLQVSAGTTF